MRWPGALAIVIALGSSPVAAAQELETETSRTLSPASVEAGVGVEYQRSPDGVEIATPTFAEVGIVDRIELMVEPVPFTQIRPSAGMRATGLGDVEITATGLALGETTHRPAIAFAMEAKVPTARDPAIGTGKLDSAGYLILSKQFGRLDAHVNLAYQLIGVPSGVTVPVSNVMSFAVAGVYRLNDALHVYAEVLGNTAAVPDGEGSSFSELTGAELVGTIGVGYRATPSMDLSLGVSFDNNEAILVHPGLTVFYDRRR